MVVLIASLAALGLMLAVLMVLVGVSKMVNH